MAVDSTSPDTGQHGGCTTVVCRKAVMLMHRRGRRRRLFDVSFPLMKSCVSLVCPTALVRLCASIFAAALVTFSALGETPTLSEVRVSARRFVDSAATLPFGVSVMTRSDIARSGVTTVNEALIKWLGVPGHLDLYGGGDYDLDLRGFGGMASSNQVVIVDGIKLNEADLGGTRLAGIAIDSVEKIEVLRGSGSVLYGGGATGGVIVMTTKAGRGSERRNQADIYTAVGSYGLREVRASGTLASGGFSIDIASNKREADNHRDNFKSDVNGRSVHLQWSNDWLRMGVSDVQDDMDTQLPGALTAAQYLANPSQTTSPLTDKAVIDNARQTVLVQAELGAWQLGLDLGQRTKSLDSLMGEYPYHYDVDASTLALRTRHESNWGNVRNILSMGHDRAKWKRTVPGVYGSVVEQNSQAFYAQNDVTFVSGSRIFAGYRSENIEQLDHDTGFSAWELGLTQPLSEQFLMYGRVGNSFRLANVDELGYTLPGAVLQSQTSRDTEVGGRWMNTHNPVELRYYRSSVTNELGYDPTVPNPTSWNPANQGANVNFDPILRQGIELEARHILSKTWALQTTLGLREATFTQGVHNGLSVPLVAHKTLSLRADWHPVAAHKTNVGVVMVSNQYVDFNNVCTVPGYAVVDARHAYQLHNVELSVGVNNLLGNSYYTRAFVCTGGITNGIYPEAGRAFTASLRIKF